MNEARQEVGERLRILERRNMLRHVVLLLALLLYSPLKQIL